MGSMSQLVKEEHVEELAVGLGVPWVSVRYFQHSTRTRLRERIEGERGCVSVYVGVYVCVCVWLSLSLPL